MTEPDILNPTGGFHDKTDNHSRSAADVLTAYQADNHRDSARRTSGFSLCQLHGDADVLDQRADPCTERQLV